MRHMKSAGFIGGGRVTRILLGGYSRHGDLPDRVFVSDSDESVLQKLQDRFPTVYICGCDNAKAAGADIIFVGLHPQSIPQVLGDIKGSFNRDALIVSLAPKVTISAMSDMLGGFKRIARMIPNAPSIVNAGFNPISFSPELSADERCSLIALFEPLGECPEVPEEHLEAYAIISGMGPTYLWFQLQALREVAAGFGLTDAEIAPAMKRMVCGGTRTLLESGLAPAEVMDLIPVKPLAEMEPQVSEMYRTRLPALYQKIKP